MMPSTNPQKIFFNPLSHFVRIVHTTYIQSYDYQWKEWCGNFGEQLLCLCENKAEISLKAFEKQNSYYIYAMIPT